MHLVDPIHGIEARAVPSEDHAGWKAQWRPLRALRDFPRFSFIHRGEVFSSEKEALAFIRLNVESILSGRI
jgi:hypothetical protein